MSNRRPGNREIANAAPPGKPTMAAMAVAEQLTIKESPTMWANQPSRERPRRQSREHSCFRPRILLDASSITAGVDPATGCFGSSGQHPCVTRSGGNGTGYVASTIFKMSLDVRRAPHILTVVEALKTFGNG